MRKIDIKITKARIKSFSVELEQDEPHVTATIELLSEVDESITTFSVSTRNYAVQKFTVPIRMIFDLKNIADQLEMIVADKCNERLTLLEGPK